MATATRRHFLESLIAAEAETARLRDQLKAILTEALTRCPDWANTCCPIDGSATRAFIPRQARARSFMLRSYSTWSSDTQHIMNTRQEAPYVSPRTAAQRLRRHL
jgi:hypothetical protein